MIPCPRLPVFIPAFEGEARSIFRGLGVVDGVDCGLVGGVRADNRGGNIVLVREMEGEGEVGGEIVWLDGTRYDEAISLVDAWFEDVSERTKCHAFDERAGCLVDCWAYLCRAG